MKVTFLSLPDDFKQALKKEHLSIIIVHDRNNVVFVVINTEEGRSNIDKNEKRLGEGQPGAFQRS